MRYLSLLLPALCLATPALADAVTYKGAIGKIPVVVEFTAPPANAAKPFAGRYFYPNKGIDIPLDALSISKGKLKLAEEEVCTDTCVADENGKITGFKQGAVWDLALGRDNTLTGKWTYKGRTQPVTLAYVGARPLPEDSEISPMGLAAISQGIAYRDVAISEDATPYDYLRMQTDLKAGKTQDFDGSAVKYLTDPRTKFAFPTIASLADGSSPTVANTALEQRHWAMNTDALNCEGQQYAGLGWFDMMPDMAGSLGGYPDETVEVSYLSPTLMSWTESGSLFCGGAHPDNHVEAYTIDVKTGQPLDLSHILKGWVAHEFDGKFVPPEEARTRPSDVVWGPDADLTAFVKAHLKPQGDPDALDESCGVDDLLANNLAVRFDKGDKLTFTLSALPNVIAACWTDLYSAPVADLKDLLAPEAKDYFPTLGG